MEFVLTYIPVITTVLAGLFAMLAAYYAWTLKLRDEKRSDRTAKRAEKIELFSTVYTLFESGLRQVLNDKEFTLHSDFSKMNAKMELLAPESIKEQYFSCCNTFELWSKYHARSKPPKQELNGMTYTTLQSPDPTAKYKPLAEESYIKLQAQLGVLKDALKADLENDN